MQGLAMAVIADGKVVLLRSWGRRNVEKNLPLQTDTVMYGASLTKLAFAYMVMQLVDERRLDLDRSIAAYLPKPLPEYAFYETLKADARWRQLTPRIFRGICKLRIPGTGRENAAALRTGKALCVFR